MENKMISTEMDLRWGTRIPFNQEVLINYKTFGMIKDISLTGCFIEIKKIFGLGQEILLRFNLNSPQKTSIETRARVVNIRPGHGIGIKFSFTDDESPKIIQQFIDQIINGQKI
ncbi:MAG: PilZ domain-containing protein [Nitrospiria bacterium]